MFAKIGDIVRDPGYELVQRPMESVKVSVTTRVTDIIEEMNKSFPMKQAKTVNKSFKDFAKEHPTASKVLGVMMMVIGLILIIGMFIPPFVVAGPGGIVLSVLAEMLGVASCSVGLVLFVNGKKFSAAVPRRNEPSIAVDSNYLTGTGTVSKWDGKGENIFASKPKSQATTKANTTWDSLMGTEEKS